MRRRELVPVALVLLVAVADAADASNLAFYLLLAAVPALVVAGLGTLEDLLEPGCLPYRRAAGVLHVVALALVLLAAVLRAPLRNEGVVPRAAISAVIACLVLFALQGLLVALPAIRRALVRLVRPRPAPPEIEIASR